MKDYQREFIEFAISNKVLTFGSFKIKSGRTSPYFFNAGLFNTGKALALLGKYYAAALADSCIEFDVLFGPAYKGIPLSASTAISLYQNHGRDTPYAFNRKEKKDHGEGGTLVGYPLSQGTRVVLIDDVISAGTAIRETMPLLHSTGSVLKGIIVALDRQEVTGGAEPPQPGTERVSAINQVEKDTGIPVLTIIKLKDIVEYLSEKGMTSEADLIIGYWKTYGVGELA
ncbi:orotate phosphoribosyltransferase [Zopfochytrium polystomum]|nr:orotate phosphoribosyltransferase [Zopfochytrium polystomum]